MSQHGHAVVLPSLGLWLVPQEPIYVILLSFREDIPLALRSSSRKIYPCFCCHPSSVCSITIFFFFLSNRQLVVLATAEGIILQDLPLLRQLFCRQDCCWVFIVDKCSCSGFRRWCYLYFVDVNEICGFVYRILGIAFEASGLGRV